MLNLPLNVWHEHGQLLQSSNSDIQQHWLMNFGSMTYLLREHAGVELSIQLLTAKTTLEINRDEAELLKLPSTQKAYCREIIMSRGAEPWLFGRSIFPLAVLEADAGALQSLGSQPLGQLLFKGEATPRLTLEAAEIDSQEALFQTLPKTSQKHKQLMARRSLFRYVGYKVLVQEVFLPDHPLYQEPQS